MVKKIENTCNKFHLDEDNNFVIPKFYKIQFYSISIEIDEY